MNRLRRVLVTLLALFVVLAPGTAQAKVVDEAGLFSAATMSQLDQRISALKSTYDRDVLIVTVATLGGQTIPQVAQRYINVPVQRIGGVYIFIARQEKKIDIAIGANTMTAIPKDKKEQIRQGLVSAFRSGSFDTGILAAVSSIDDDLRLARSAGLPASAPDQVPVVRTAPAAPVESRASSGGGMGLFGWIFIIFIGWLVFSVIRGLFRGATGGGGGPMYGGGGGGPMYGGGGYGAPMGGGGGGGFWGNFLGGVGGAMAGNWLYDKMSGRGEGYTHSSDSSSGYYTGGVSTPSSPDWSNSTGSGWSDDGGASWGGGDSGGSWGGSDSFGDSGGGFGGDSSFGDSGGGFGGDSGGGGDWS